MNTIVNRGVFERTEPSGKRLPLLFELPQSGITYPHDFVSTAPFNSVHHLTSPYVDELLVDAHKVGATVLFASFPMTYVNANRSELDMDETLLEEPWPIPVKPTAKTSLGLPVIQKIARPGIELYSRKLSVAEVSHRLEKYYRPYHAEIENILADFRSKFGGAWHIDWHCMSPVGGAMSSDMGKKRADFCVGDRDGTTSAVEFVEVIVSLIKSMGYSVTINDPFKGVEIIERHGSPKNNIHCVQIEIGRALFLEHPDNRKSRRFDSLKSDLQRFAGGVANYVRSKI